LSEYRVIAQRSNRVIRQKFYVTIVDPNGKTLFISEMLGNKDYAVALGQKFAAKLDGNFINAT
jgi:hypothetical protein